MHTFPEGFLWGAATASYQIEGAANQDGRAPSVWDAFSQTPGKVFEGHSGDVACDHYNRFAGDVQLMAELGLQAYRFSISWSRLFPEGVGTKNPKGFEFYDRLIDSLCAAGIKVAPTLYHWDMPQCLFEQGGWLHADSPYWFAEYAEACARAFGNRVDLWMTFNEPQVFVGLGHQTGIHAPGLQLGWPDIKTVIRNVLLSHGRAVTALRTHAKEGAKIGIAPVGHGMLPQTDTIADIEAARLRTFAHRPESIWEMPVWLDPILDGGYRDAGAVSSGWLPEFTQEELQLISQPIDFVGLNIYFSEVVKAGAQGPESIPNGVGEAQTMMKWYVRPDSLYWVPKFFGERWPKTPVYITENGLSNQDWVALDGKVHDASRIDFLNRYLLSLRRACAEGVDLRGYFHWSFMDNFEWAEGYRERFGLIHVDYGTLARTPKNSFYWYRDVIRSNGASL